LWLIGAREAFFVRNLIHGDERGHGLPVPRKSPNPMERRSTAPFQAQCPDRILFLCFFWCRSSGIAFASLDQKTYAQGIKISEGIGGLPMVSLLSPHGSEAEIYLFGGCITSWKVSNGKDLLFVRPDAVFNGKKPISGGIPHCFPQFGPGPIQQV
ncbi:hypothetical protein BHE74_00004335, partial [Ensete ventricosum]